jgi:FixJ family two-component response regulator
MTIGKQHIFLVDDEPGVRKAVAQTLKRLGHKITTFPNAADCLEKLPSQNCDLLITDVKMPGMDGIELVSKAKRIIPWLPILVITGYGDIPMAVRAVKAGAIEFIEKPLHRQTLLDTVQSALKQNDLTDFLKGKQLTKVETTVLRLLLQGKSNKEIAYMRRRSIRTIEDHRSHIMRKLNVDNLVDLVKRATDMRLVKSPQTK